MSEVILIDEHRVARDKSYERIAKSLIKKDSLPSSGLKRNSDYYLLITYINHTIALLLSEEYDN